MKGDPPIGFNKWNPSAWCEAGTTLVWDDSKRPVPPMGAVIRYRPAGPVGPSWWIVEKRAWSASGGVTLYLLPMEPQP